MAVFTKTSVPARAHTLPREYYTAEDIFRREDELIFSRRWLCVGREEQLPAAGSYFLAEAAGESIIVVRGADGAVRAFYNVCRHRGTRMCTQDHGKFPGAITCPYHAWTYGLDGALTAARNMQEVEGFDRSEWPLKPVALASWEGFIFINLADRPQPFAEAFAPLLGRFSKWHIADTRVASTIEYDLHCNWKLIFQNYSECYHCPLVHPALDKLSPSQSGRNDLGEGPFLGGYMELREHGTSMTMTGRSKNPPLGEVSGEELDHVYYYAIFPSLLLSLHPDYIMAHFARPLSVNRTQIVCKWLFDPKTMSQPGFDPSDAVDFWDMTNRQDWHVCELSQLGVQSRAYTPGPYANQEGLLYQFDRNYLKAMES
ncbi:MAG TPA: aromatic ring-hydroxylating dioxygenase subunit alpha [Candidatus Eremiobacteraceae bacterium]|nr:aromatic ring-hydroxylating dioxygenase subunit alpha [Candidatus Eremiobacteraceae bacterium]